MKDSLRALTHRLIDYAGLFPPASLDMNDAVVHYDRYLHGERRELLGRFIVPATRLDEFEQAAGLRLDEDPVAWHLSLIGSADPADDAVRAHAFNARHPGGARIDTVELRAPDGWSPDRLRETLEGFVTYVEIPATPDAADALEELRKAGLRAKIRTGGLTQDVFPAPEAVLQFISECLHHRVPFKATAGLHHPLRCRRPLTYEPDAPLGTMHGFVNLFLAAAFLHDGLAPSDVAPLLEETDPSAFAFADDAASWRAQSVATRTIQESRRLFATSFGSCSFDEPLEDLMQLGWLSRSEGVR